MPINGQLNDYYTRFDPALGYEEHMFRAGRVLQSAEMNEIQQHIKHRVRGIADSIFKDGAVIRDARIIIDPDNGECFGESGAIYIVGAVRGVAPKNFGVPIVGEVQVGVYLQQTVITELEDPSLREPVQDTRNYQEPGAGRLKEEITWGWFGDGQDGDFFPIYTVVDGVVRIKEAPPNLDAVTQSIARYDRDNSGGNYVVSGLNVLRAQDAVGGEQTYVISAGRARVMGYAVDLPADTRLVYNAIPDLREINAEPHNSATASLQRINTDRFPIDTISEIQFTEEKTVTVVRGSVAGGADPLPDTSVLSLVSVTQGATTYVVDTNVRLFQGKVDWSLPGAEPATGSTYTVTYRYIKTVVPAPGDYDDTGFNVTGALPGTLVLVTYTAKLPRVDRLCLTQDGNFVWVSGAASDFNPAAMPAPSGTLGLAIVIQTWMSNRKVVQDAVRTVPMNELAAINGRMDLMMDLISRQQLIASASVRESGMKKGMLVDPFLDDSVRDMGLTQTASIANGFLTLPIAATATTLPRSGDQPFVLDPVYSINLQQTLRTGGMKVNPYMAFPPTPARVSLNPAQDFWTETRVVNVGTIEETQTLTNTASQTERLGNAYHWGYGNYEQVVGQYSTTQTSSSSTVGTRSLGSSKTGSVEFLRQIDVKFEVYGFDPSEQVTELTFDGIAVTPQNI